MRFIPGLVLLIFSFQTFAYPIFFKCEDTKITFKDSFNDDDLFNRILQMEKGNRLELFNQWCGGVSQCLQDLDFIARLAQVSVETARRLFEEELQKMKMEFDAKDVSHLDIEEFSLLNESFTSLRACQEVKSQLNPEDFVSNERVLTPYPFYSNYMYATGCGGVDAQGCSPIDQSDLDRVIEESVVMGVDPYLVLSLSLMEGGTGEVGQLYLDPIGIMDSIGCSGEQIGNGARPDEALNSYGTSYIVNSEVKRIPSLQGKLSAYFNTFNIEKEEGNSFYCYNVRGSEEPSVFERPQSDSCCLDLGFKTSVDSSDQIQHALTYQFVDKITRSPFRGRSDPAWRAQRYNGYTDLMGAAESVSPWRAGVNYYESPAYGYQTMDFILNALMFNPYISSKVEEMGQKHGDDWDSLLCKGKRDGTYYVDSDYYFNQHKDSPRLEAVYNKFQRGVPFARLSSREKNVLLADMEETALQNSQIPDRLPQYREDRLSDNLHTTLNPEGEADFELIAYEMLEKSDWLAAIQGKHSLRSSDLDFIYEYELRQREYDNTYSRIEEKQQALIERMNSACEPLQGQAMMDCYDLSNQVADYLYGEVSNWPLGTIESEEWRVIFEEAQLIGQERKAMEEAMEKVENSFSANAGHLMSKQREVLMVMESVQAPESLEQALARHESSPGFSEQAREDFSVYYNSVLNRNEPYDRNAAYREYFREIYPSRSTLQESSVFPWRRFNEEEVQKLVNQFKRF